MKRIMVLLLVLVLCLGTLILPAFATVQDDLEVTLTTDKENYEANESIVATLTVKNIGTT